MAIATSAAYRRRYHPPRDAGHGLELGLVSVAVDVGNRVPDEDHPIIMLDPAADSIRDADASGDTRYDAGGHTQIAQDRIERGVREPAEAFLDDQVFAFLGL